MNKTSLTEKYNKINYYFLNPCHWITDLKRLKIIIVGSCICSLVHKPSEFVFLSSRYMSIMPRSAERGTEGRGAETAPAPRLRVVGLREVTNICRSREMPGEAPS